MNPFHMGTSEGRMTDDQRWQAVLARDRDATAGHSVWRDANLQRSGGGYRQPTCSAACAANPAALVIPCHRVIRSNGGLGGYKWGIERKRALLAQEARSQNAQSTD